jgi:hypothetical protein
LEVFLRHKLGQVCTVHIRFRFYKGAENFSIQKFSFSLDPILDPVDVAISILHRATILKLPEWDPVSIYGNLTKSKIYFLRDFHVRDQLRAMCAQTYTDPTHYLCINIKRMTAAVCLQMGEPPFTT